MITRGLELYESCILLHSNTINDAINAFILKGIIKNISLPNILFIIDDESVLIGILSLSDLLSKTNEDTDVNGSICEIANKTPKVLNHYDCQNDKKRISHIFAQYPSINTFPVVDDNGILKCFVEKNDNPDIVDIAGFVGDYYSTKLSLDDVKRVLSENISSTTNNTFKDDWYLTFYNDKCNKNPLSHWALKFIVENLNMRNRIYLTGGGACWSLFRLAELGYEDLHGSDIAHEPINAAKQLAEMYNYKINLWAEDALNPNHIPEQCDMILAIHWIYYAWNYAYSQEDKEYNNNESYSLLDNFVSKYQSSIKKGGFLLIELIDPLSEFYHDFNVNYKFKHSSDMVKRVLDKYGFEVVDKLVYIPRKISVSYLCRKIVTMM